MDNETNILLDAGISAARIKSCLSEFGLSPEDLSAIAVTHEHSDHINGLRVLTKKQKIPVYTSGGTARTLVRMGVADEDILHILPVGEGLKLGSLCLTAFETPHDSAESYGYLVDCAEGRLAIATDLGCVTKTVARALQGCHTLVLESNHDVDMLKYGPYPQNLKMRILGNRGHLSNESSAAFAEYAVRCGTRRILLAHLSSENNTAELALEAAAAHLGSFPISVAPKNGFSEVLEIV